MSKLVLMPPTASSITTPEFQPSLFSEKSTESRESGFAQFLKGAYERGLETDPYQEKPVLTRAGENKAKSEPKKDEGRTVGRSSRDEAEPGSNSVRKAVNHGAEKDISQSRKTDTDEEVTAEDQKTDVNQGEAEIIALLAHLAEAEAVIRGETQPATIQTAGLAEAMAEPELVTAIEGSSLSVGLRGEVLGVAEMAEPGVKTMTTDMAKLGVETLTASEAEPELLSADAGLNIATTKPDFKAVLEGGTTVPHQAGQIMPQSLRDDSSLDENSLANQGNNSGDHSRLSKGVKVSINNGEIKAEGQSFGKDVFGEDALSQKVETELTQPGDQRLQAEPGLSSVSKGKVNLVVLQTQLAVNDKPELKAEIPVLNVIPGQPSFGNVSQIQASGSTEVASANKEELFSQIVEQAKVMINNGGSEMEVSLKPEHLGRLQLKVTIENEVVTAKFVAESQQVKEIIESNLGQLRRSLQENGIQVDMLMVSVGYQQSNESFEQAAYNREGLRDFGGEIGRADDGRETKVEESNRPVEHDGLIDLIA